METMAEQVKIQTRKEFEHFFKANHTDLVLYANKFVQQTDVASDIVQEAFVKLWENKSKIVANVSLRAYLFKVVYNLSINHIEQRKLHLKHHQNIYDELLDIELDYYKDEKSILQEERISLLRKMLKELPRGCFEIIQLSRFDGLKNKEIAKKINAPLRTVETRIYRCISRLKELIAIAK